jgi:hypothetical protein
VWAKLEVIHWQVRKKHARIRKIYKFNEKNMEQNIPENNQSSNSGLSQPIPLSVESSIPITSAVWLSGSKLVALIVVAILIIGTGTYFAFFAKVSQPGDQLASNSSQNLVKQSDVPDNGNQSSGSDTVTPAQSGNSQIIASCDDIITFDQVKNIAGTTALIANSNKNENNGYADFGLGCGYMADVNQLKAGGGAPSVMGLIGFYSFQRNPDKMMENYNDILSTYSNLTPIDGLGSIATKGDYNGNPVVGVVSSNKKSFFTVLFSYKDQPGLGTPLNYDKSLQIEKDIAKIINVNLNK